MKFSETSLERLNTAHHDLILIMLTAIEMSEVDFGIAEGHRSVERQQELFKNEPPLTKIDGVNTLSKHNHNPSMAIDIYAYVHGKADYDLMNMAYLGGLITGIAKILKREGSIEHNIRWGGNWDQDGEILTDQRFDDLPHFELV